VGWGDKRVYHDNRIVERDRRRGKRGQEAGLSRWREARLRASSRGTGMGEEKERFLPNPPPSPDRPPRACSQASGKREK